MHLERFEFGELGLVPSNMIFDWIWRIWASPFKFCILYLVKMKWTESGYRPLLCTYRLNWARRTSWGWWDEWDDTALQTQNSKFKPWNSEAEHATSRSRRLPTILSFTSGWGRNITLCRLGQANSRNSEFFYTWLKKLLSMQRGYNKYNNFLYKHRRRPDKGEWVCFF